MPIPDAVPLALAGALSLVFPTWCAGCDTPDVTLCPDCADALTARPSERTIAGGVRVWSALPFDGVPARVIRALKEDGRTGLARPLGRALAEVMPGGAVVVPIPSSRAAMRRRGYPVAELLARRAGAAPRRLLVPGRITADQRGLGRAARAQNVAGAFRAREVAGISILLVDDVVTTGATLAEAARVLAAGGAHVVGAATVAATARSGFLTASHR